MADTSAPLLFLKATHRQQVFVPSYTRQDGIVVMGHYASVHMSDEHDTDKLLEGHGSHSQKQAHAKLTKQDWFHGLPHDHKVSVLLEHATEVQDKASAAAVLSVFRKKVLAGGNPSPAELKRFESAPLEKQQAIVAEARAAGKLDSLPKHFHGLVAPTKEADVSEKAAPRVVGGKVAEKVADNADDHHAVIHAAKLPASNTNAKVVNAKLDAIAAALKSKDADLLTMMSYGSNTYGVKAAAMANHALKLLGSSERVSPGHKGTPGFRTDGQMAAAKNRAKQERSVDPERDSLITAIAKLGGLKRSDISSKWGYGERDMKGHRVGIKPVFSVNGLSPDRMGQALHELGYLQSDEHGRFDGRELEDHVSDGLGGSHHFTPQGFANKADDDYAALYQSMSSEDVAGTGFNDQPSEVQDAIEEIFDEHSRFSADEIEFFSRMASMAKEAEHDAGASDAGAEGFGHGHFHEADDEARRSAGSQVSREPGSDDEPLKKALPLLVMKALRADGWKKPTSAQAVAGNYKKPRMKWNGLDINIENPAGTVREGTDETGAKWRTVFAYAYGEIAGTEGVDGDPVDVYMGPDESAPEVYIVRQMKRKKWDTYDEDKCFLGFKSMADAKKAYLDHYDDPRFFGGIVAMPVAEFVDKARATRERPAMIKALLFHKPASVSYLSS